MQLALGNSPKYYSIYLRKASTSQVSMSVSRSFIFVQFSPGGRSSLVMCTTPLPILKAASWQLPEGMWMRINRLVVWNHVSQNISTLPTVFKPIYRAVASLGCRALSWHVVETNTILLSIPQNNFHGKLLEIGQILGSLENLTWCPITPEILRFEVGGHQFPKHTGLALDLSETG